MSSSSSRKFKPEPEPEFDPMDSDFGVAKTNLGGVTVAVATVAARAGYGKISYTELAQTTGYGVSHIHLVLHGKRTPSLVCARELARALGISLDTFYDLLAAAGHG